MADLLCGAVFVASLLVLGTLGVRVADACDRWMKPVFRGFLKPEVRSHYDEHD